MQDAIRDQALRSQQVEAVYTRSCDDMTSQNHDTRQAVPPGAWWLVPLLVAGVGGWFVIIQMIWSFFA